MIIFLPVSIPWLIAVVPIVDWIFIMIFPLAFFSMGGGDDEYNPLKIDYSNPMFLNLNYSGKFNPLWVVFPENYTDTDWVSSKLLGRQSMRQDFSSTCS